MQRHHGWFVGFAPVDKPEIVVAALAEHSFHGGPAAGHTVRAIMAAYFNKYHPEMAVEGKKALPALAPAPTVEGE
jgi:penicillin-binding protein 2